MTADLIAFLRAALDEDEQVAREASRFHHDDRPMTPNGEHWHWVEPDGDQPLALNPVQDEYLNGGGQVALRSVEGYPTSNARTLSHFVVSYAEEVLTMDAMHIARWDPARVLAEVAAKRAVLDAYAEAEHLQRVGWDNDEPSKYEYMAREEALEKVVRLLAQPYAGHPGWREEWRA